MLEDSVSAVISEVRNNTGELISVVQVKGLEIGLRLLGAILIWVLGRILIRSLAALFEKAMLGKSVDQTITRYFISVVKVVCTFLLVMVVLGWIGVETATFAALLAGAGLAIGTAWGGLLQHLAAGLFMVVIRPFRVGDVISAAGVQGTVEEMGLIVTRITTFDNVRTLVGNNRLFSDNILNYSANPFRRVELTVIVDHATNLEDVIARVRERVEAVDHVLEDPRPLIEIEAFTLAGPRLVVRPFCDNRHYWQVLFDTNRAIHQAVVAGGFSIPSQRYQVETPIGPIRTDAIAPKGR